MAQILSVITIMYNNIADHQIICLLQDNNLLAWEKLYDKYSPSMFGLICNLTGDKILAEKIFVSAFFHLKEEKILSHVNFFLCPTLLKYTYNFTLNQLKLVGKNPKHLTSLEEVKLIQLLCTHCDSLNEVGSILNLTEKEIKIKLRTEFLHLRNCLHSNETDQVGASVF